MTTRSEQSPVTADEFRSRFAALCRSGVGPGLPRKSRDAAIFLRAATQALVARARWSERELQGSLDAWIESAGERVQVDGVSLRRSLVDAGFLERDPAGTSYRAVLDPSRGPAFASDVAGIDPIGALAEARADAAAKARRHGTRTRLELVRGDIVQQDVDAIVNAANGALAPGGGVCGVIFAFAGPELEPACYAHGGCPTGEARLTPGFRLRARHVIHAVGPVWAGGTNDEPALLASAYRASLEIAEREGLASVAFPAISTGIYGYPIPDAARVALTTIRDWLRDHDRPEFVRMVLWSEGDLAAWTRAREALDP
ncbi:MAG: macro domain-containing protein [Gemmatimonadetes bacterium]|nr:macro domain-containing protein [Gemmatimonadota bacterium]